MNLKFIAKKLLENNLVESKKFYKTLKVYDNALREKRDKYNSSSFDINSFLIK